ncbi:hypothetical protein SAMN04489724_4713 [Algoriphagus locisalis]|uniref:Acetyltransferase (GNAT) domain-containing protein n=1 Tax=Algoriphagus locisalis TaxID=305507 RepID=A0A1I7E1P2_9BACT|nr:hypothetical protein [Algoriphagus locisalis]SFU17858.1 hypothetical protein SAMN04489724_4713 [Algoriphagus locisalis]
MESFKKEIYESHELRVVTSQREDKDYFLSNFPFENYQEQLDFIWEKKQKTKALISFAISITGEAISLPKSPFGGFWIIENSSSASIEAFILASIEELESRGIKSITIIQAPKPYQPHADLINYLLFKSGFVQENVMSHQFFIGRKKLKKLAQKESSKLLSKSKNSDLQVRYSSISNFGFLKEIKSWNSQKGYEIAVDENRIVQQVSEYPHRYFLITLSKNAVPIGYSLGVKLTSNSLYYFLSAINPKIQVKNGGELIVNALFQLAVEQKVDFIDLGSSDLEDEVNHKLMFFKSRFSNDMSNKITWVKKL